jgi:hypothetical protein
MSPPTNNHKERKYDMSPPTNNYKERKYDMSPPTNNYKERKYDMSPPTNCVCLVCLYLQLFVGGLISYLRYMCLFGSSLPPVVCRRSHVLFTRHEPSYKQLEVKTNQTNTYNVNKT